MSEACSLGTCVEPVDPDDGYFCGPCWTVLERLVWNREAAIVARAASLADPPPPRFVYFVERASDGAIKIGFSSDPRRRLKALRRGNGPCRILKVEPGGAEAERALHREFAHLAEGHEWFRPDARLLERAGA